MDNKFFVFVALIIALLVLSRVTGCDRGYSEGDRTGTVTKFSHKGLAIKSWEGELVMGGIRATATRGGASIMAANVWEFTVKDEAVAKTIENAMQTGETVDLHYIQYLIAPMSMDTKYDVTAVTVANKPEAH